MGRPKYDVDEETARDKLVRTFWESLSEVPFSDITVRSLCRKAELNHNTFYRHFGSIEELAREAFDESVIKGLPAALLSGTVGIKPNEGEFAEGLRKAGLYAGSGSGLLAGIVRESIAGAWFEAAGVDGESLSSEQRIDCDIMFGGVVAVMGDPAIEFDGDTMQSILKRPLGKGMLATMRNIAS